MTLSDRPEHTPFALFGHGDDPDPDKKEDEDLGDENGKVETGLGATFWSRSCSPPPRCQTAHPQKQRFKNSLMLHPHTHTNLHELYYSL